MDIQRTLLIGAAVLLSFMLLTEWVAFKDARSNPPVADARLTAQNGSAPAVPGDASDLPDTPVAPAASGDAAPTLAMENVDNDDLPTLPAAGTDAAASPEEASAPAADIISVHTDTLELAIDLRGGDIVEVALRKFLERLEDPDTPFILLESGAARMR